MNRPRNGRSTYRSIEEVADAQDLRAVISAAVATTPIDEQALRHGVWTYVGAERHAGAAPGHVIMALTDMVEDARIDPPSVRQELLRRVILWSVEAYFGHLGGDVMGRDGQAFSDVAMQPSSDEPPTG
jgi:hypothetical protein